MDKSTVNVVTKTTSLNLYELLSKTAEQSAVFIYFCYKSFLLLNDIDFISVHSRAVRISSTF